MKYLMTMLWLAPMTVFAGAFDGRWVGDVATATLEGRPDSYLLQNGEFTCSACTPEVKIPADGRNHKVSGHSYYDEMSATVVSPQRVKLVTTLAGRKNYERTLTVSADGKSLTDDYVSYQGSNPAPAKFAYTRVQAGPPGAHAISGSWQQDTSHSAMSNDLVTVTYQESSAGMKMTTPTGQSYDARFDGKEYPIAGDPGKTMVSLERLGERKIRETDRRQGKIADVFTMEVSADGQTMQVVDEDQVNSMKLTYTAKKK